MATEHHPLDPPRPKMGSNTFSSSSSTAGTKAGIAGLWKLGVKCNKLALSWKFVEDMAKKDIGVHEVEREAWNRAANREVKKGKDRPRIKGRYTER